MKLNIYAAALAASCLCSASPLGLSATKKAADVNVRCSDVELLQRGDNMRLTFTMLLDSMHLGSNEQITFRPLLVAETDSTLAAATAPDSLPMAVFTPVVVNGRNMAMKIQRNPSWAAKDAIEVNRKKGSQAVTYSATVPYAPWMEYARLDLAEDLCGCGDIKNQDRIPLGGIDNRPPAAPAMVYITPTAEAVKARDESGSAFVDFIVNKTNIVPTYRNNRAELAKITSTIDLVKNDPFVSITNIDLHGYASPEGSYANNTRLASGRSEALRVYVKGLYDMPDRIFTSHYTPEDWGNLRKLVEASSLPERTEILAIIDGDLDPDAKDHEIRRRFPKTYSFMLNEWYPGLRHTDYKVSYVVRPLTIDEAKQVLKTNPKNLSLNEMFLVAQTYTPGSPEFNNVFETAVKVFPDDPTANLNAAVTALNANDLAAAARYLKKAGSSPEAEHARGILAMKEGRFAEADRLLQQAEQHGIQEATGNIEILRRTEHLAKVHERALSTD